MRIWHHNIESQHGTVSLHACKLSLMFWRSGRCQSLTSQCSLPKWAVCDAVMHSEAMECGLSAEGSLQETEHTSATGPGLHAFAMQHAALSFTAMQADDAEDASQGSFGGMSESQLPGQSQLEATGREAAHNESSRAASVQGNSAATASVSGENASCQTRRPLELLAASHARQSLPASAAASASPASSLMLSTQHSATEGQMQQAVPMNSSGGESSRHISSGQAAKTAARGQSLDDPAASYTGTDEKANPVHSAEVDVLHSKDNVGEPAETAAMPEPSLGGSSSHSKDLVKEADETAAMSEPRLGSRSQSQQEAFTVSASSKSADAAPFSDSQRHAELSQNPMAAAEDACTTVAALGRTLGSAAETSVAAGLSTDASRDSIALHDDEKPVENAAAVEQTRISSSSSASGSGREHIQIDQDAPAGQPALSSSRNSGSSSAETAVATRDAALHLHSSTAARSIITAGSHAEEAGNSIGSKAAQAIPAVGFIQHSSRSSIDEAASAERPGRSSSLSNRSSASRVSVSSHAQPERSLSPKLPAVLNASLRSDNATAQDGQASVSNGKGMAGSNGGASPSAPVDQWDSLTGASVLGRSAKRVASLGTSLSKLGGGTADAVNSSLSQMGKEGGGGVIRHSVILSGMDPLDQWLYRQPGVLTSLDYNKVNTDLQVCHKLLLLLPGIATV